MGRVAAIDHGTKRTGLALSDNNKVFAFPGDVFYDEAALCDYLLKLQATGGIEAVVVGLPYNMDGTEGERAKDVRSFCARLEKKLNLEIITWDERLSSFEAESMIQGVKERGKRGKEQVDIAAAQVILRSYLASLEELR